MCVFSVCFQTFLFMLDFRKIDCSVPWYGFLCIYPAWAVWTSWICKLIISHHIWEIFSHFFKYIYYPSSLFYPSESLISYMFDCLIICESISLRLYSPFFFSMFLNTFYWFMFKCIDSSLQSLFKCKQYFFFIVAIFHLVYFYSFCFSLMFHIWSFIMYICLSIPWTYL